MISFSISGAVYEKETVRFTNQYAKPKPTQKALSTALKANTYTGEKIVYVETRFRDL
ncbi:MAG: hypothetical protein LBQ52_02220 [Helicobacteraceae bacterium]|jgi:hypothetical protein|nr:hypothetical protein [Helicobacteraceae bacterium]